MVDDHMVIRLAEHGRLRTVAAGTRLLQQGERPARAYVLCAGSVRLCRRVGRRYVTVQVMRAGEVFGAVPWLSGSFELLQAHAIADSTLVELSATTVVGLLRAHPDLATAWLHATAARANEMQQRLWTVLHQEAAVDHDPDRSLADPACREGDTPRAA